MNRKLIHSLKVTVAAVLFASAGFFNHAHADDILDVDTTEILFGFIDPTDPPRYSGAETQRLREELAAACKEAEAIWSARIIGYSKEVPGGMRSQLTTLKIRCQIRMIDCDGDDNGNIFAIAGPDVLVAMSRTVGDGGVSLKNNALPLEATVTFDYCDLGSLSDLGVFTWVAAHEIGHAIGVGFWNRNSLSGPVTAVGIDSYVGGKYALPAYRLETSNPYATFIPLQQVGIGSGPDSISVPGGHWPQGFEVFDPAIGAERPDLMVPALDAVNPGVFISETTFGACADMGYTVTGFNEGLKAPEQTAGKWPKIVGPGLNPFGPALPVAPEGVSIRRVSSRLAVRAPGDSAVTRVEVAEPSRTDPFNLRRHRWVKDNKNK